jgi:hypothetical protein
LCLPWAASAIGFGPAAGLYTVNGLPVVEAIPVAARSAVSSFEAGLLGSGVPPLVVDDLVDDLSLAIDTVDAAVDDLLLGSGALLLSRLPIPAVGACFEIGLPLILADTLRLELSWLTEGMVVDAVSALGFALPTLPYTVVADGVTLVVDPSFSTLWASAEVAGRLGIVIAAIEASVGIDGVWGTFLPGVTLSVPEFQSVADDALGALHLEEIRWAATAIHAGLGIEVGPPFLRLYARVRGVMTLTSSMNEWWPVPLSSLAARFGVVVRF